MRESLGEYAPYISIFGLFLLAGAAVVGQLDGMPSGAAVALVAVGIALLAAWPLLRPEDIRTVLGARQTRFGGNALAMTIAVIGILSVLNFLGTRYYASWDVTANRRFSISRQTIQILDDLAARGQKVRVTALVPEQGAQRGEAERLLDQYARKGGAVSYEIVDPMVDRLAYGAVAQRIGEDPPGQGLVVEAVPGADEGAASARHAIGFSMDEQEMTRLILEATREQKRRVEFTTGHGEYALDGASEGRGYTGIKAALEREGAEVGALDLATVTDTLAADAIVVAGPRRPFQPEEVERLEAYVDGGGALLVLLDPQTETGLDDLLVRWGITARNDVVLDPGRPYLNQPQIPAITGEGYRFHTITKDLTTEKLVSAMPGARSLAVDADAVPGATLTPILETSPNAWGETTLEAGAEARPDDADAKGPLTLGVVGEASAPDTGSEGESPAAGAPRKGRIVVFGSAAMISDGFFQQLGQIQMLGLSVGNGNLVLNAVNWLTQDEALISIRPTEPDDRPISPPQKPWLLLLATTLLAPLAVAGVGGWIWWQRR